MTAVDIEHLIAHRGPMRWLDEFVASDGDAVHCRLTIREEQVFVHDGVVEPTVSIEWMAQSIAALVGLLDRKKDMDPRPGYLIAIPEATFAVDQFALGDVLDVYAKRVWGDDELASFECRVERAGSLCASAQISVYRRALPGSLTK